MEEKRTGGQKDQKVARQEVKNARGRGRGVLKLIGPEKQETRRPEEEDRGPEDLKKTAQTGRGSANLLYYNPC